MDKVYRTPKAALKAAQKKIGGRIVTVDGAPALAITIIGLSGRVVDDYLTAKGAARKAGIKYQPKGD
jgi:hypothetical protein